MKTGYFGKVRNYPKDKGYRFVSIARFAKFWDDDIYSKLAPPTEIIKLKDEKLYEQIYYEKVLSKLNPQQVFDELGEHAVLLCYEKFSDIENGKAFCHRRMVAKWLEENLGVKVDEL